MNDFTKIAAAACLVLIGTSASAATVINGSFEDIGSGSLNDSGWNHFSGVPGWTGLPNIEIQSEPTLSGIDAQDGNNYAELDTNQDGGISQNIHFEVGNYELSFFYSPRVNAFATSTNDMRFSIGQGSALTSGSILGAPDFNYPWGEWTEVTSRFSVAEEGFYALSFFAQGGSYSRGCGNCGALIDNVNISAVPLPASALLLLVGVGGLGCLRKRRSSVQNG